jgi:hypothetical protein
MGFNLPSGDFQGCPAWTICVTEEGTRSPESEGTNQPMNEEEGFKWGKQRLIPR